MGKFADRKSVWFDPWPWAFVVASITWFLLLARQIPCLPNEADSGAGSLVRTCYSDITQFYRATTIGSGGIPFFTIEYNQLPVIGWFVTACAAIAHLFGAPANADQSAAQLAYGAQIFFAVSVVALFFCFLMTVRCYLYLGRDSDNGKRTSWDALLISAAPPILLAGVINWELVPTALVAGALLFWVRRKPVWAGALLGVAVSAKLYPAAVLVTLIVLAVRHRKFQDLRVLLVGAASSWAIINVPIMLVSFDRWLHVYQDVMGKGPEAGSLWYVMKLSGLELRGVAWLTFWLLLFGAVLIIRWALRSPVAPRIGQLAFLLTALVVILNPMYAPQHAIWLWPLLVLARPRKADLVAFAIAETIYFAAIWAHLGGPLSYSVWGPHELYPLSVFIHVGVLLFICFRIVLDVRQPWRDSLRVPGLGDPIAGVFADAETGSATATDGKSAELPRHSSSDSPADPAAEDGAASESTLTDDPGQPSPAGV